MYHWPFIWHSIWKVITDEATYGWAAVIVAAAALFWAVRYVQATVRIARATERQGEILSSPAVAVYIPPRDPANKPLPLGGVYVIISNNANVHAKVKLTLEARIRNLKTNQIRDFPAPEPYNGKVWPLFARQGFTGHFRLQIPDYKPGEDELRLVGRLECSSYDRDDYQPAPQILYTWKDGTQQEPDARWIPCPPEE